MKRLLLVVLLLAVFLIVPVSAYSVAETYEITALSGQSVSTAWGLYVADIELFANNITVVEDANAVFYSYNRSLPTSGTYSTALKDRDTSQIIGNGTWSYICTKTDLGAYDQLDCTLYLQVEDINRGALTGTRRIISDVSYVSEFPDTSFNYGTSESLPANFATFVFDSYFSQSMVGDYTLWQGAYTPPTTTPTPTPTPTPEIPPGMIRSMVQCVDSQTNGAIDGCDISILDKENSSWSNITDRFDGTWHIDTLPGHHIDAYGWADDYTPSPTYRLNLLSSGTVMYELLMHPGYVPPAAEGKVWLYVIVNDADSGASLENAHVVVSGASQTTKSDYTDSSGSMHIQWVNSSVAYVTADKAGYTTVSKTITTSALGPDTLRIELHRSTVTPTATMTTGPGGTVPTTADPWKNPDGSYKDGYTNHQGQEIMNLLAYHGYDLVLLCILVTILALLGVKLGGK